MKRFLPIILSLSIVLLLFLYLSFRVFVFFRPFLPFTDYLLGVDKPTTYLVLLGNDAEMRANGGFSGSYAKIILSSKRLEFLNPRVLPAGRHGLEFSPEISFQDIYVPNGQIKGLYVTPPEPIQQAFGHGTWELANADWEPDFPSAAKSIRWFLEKGKETNPDILAILNLSTIRKVLNIVGSFPVPEYKATLTPDNLYLFLQGKAEIGFFPGSTQKKDALTAVGQALVKKVKSLSLLQKFKIAQTLFLDLQGQNIVVHSLNPDFQSFLVEKNFAGVFQPEAMDTYAMIETNLGANKANAYVTRATGHQVSYTDGQAHHEVNIKFQNASLETNPNPPFHYGGDYIAYLRLYLPANAKNITITRSPEGKPPLDLTPTTSTDSASPSANFRYGLTELGFWHKTTAGNESTINLAYDLPLPSREAYTLAILKQHGLVTSPQIINLLGKTYSTPLEVDFRLP